jgi:Zn-dependent peptidase ImmA (M78 family)
MALAIINIQPSILTWARTSLGLSVEEVAAKLKREVAEIIAWEKGDQRPTYAQLEALAERVYKRPIAVFFLPAPPVEDTVLHDFRTESSRELTRLSTKTKLSLRKARALQLTLREVFGPKNPNATLKSISLENRAQIVNVITDVREVLDLDPSQQLKWKGSRQAFNDLRSRIEGAGIFVFQFPVDDIRGFALQDDEYPVIGISTKDEFVGKIFTLIHELAHLLTGNSDLFGADAPSTEHSASEQLSNELAAKFLLPDATFQEQFTNALSPNGEITDVLIEQLARKFKVGRIVIVRKLLEQRIVDREFYASKQALYRQQQSTRQTQAADSNGGGPSPFVTRVSHLGRTFLHGVFDQFDAGMITAQQAAEYTGTKINHFDKLREKLT